MLKKVIDKNFSHMIRLEYILGSSSHRTVLIAGVVLVVITQLFFCCRTVHIIEMERDFYCFACHEK